MELLEPDFVESPTLEQFMQMLLPLQDALDILSGKWKLKIIFSLKFGNKRFSELRREIPGITAKMLSKELRELEINELVEKGRNTGAVKTVEYGLTDYGTSLKPVVTALYQWGAAHRKRVIGKE